MEPIEARGVIFEVQVIDPATNVVKTIATKTARYDGSLDEISADLTSSAGKTVIFRLQVSTAGRSTADWAVWASAAVTSVVVDKKISEVIEVKRPSVEAAPTKPTSITGLKFFKPTVIGRIKLTPEGVLPPIHKVEDIGPMPVEEPMTLLNRVYKDNQKPDTYYYLPREINLVRERKAGGYRVSAVWTQDQKVRMTMTIQADVDPEDVKLMDEALKKVRGPAAMLKSMPYDQAEIIDMKCWEDWQIENIRVPTFGSLETQLPINITMTPDTLAQLKPLLEKEGLTAGMHIKTGDIEREIPIKVGLKYFTGRMYSGVEELGYSFNEAASILTLHAVRNLTDFPLNVSTVSLRFQLPNGEEIYKNLKCVDGALIPPWEAQDLQVSFAPRGLLLAEYRRLFPTPPVAPKKKSPLLEKVLDVVKKQKEEKQDQEKVKETEAAETPAPLSTPADPRVDAFFKAYARSFWMEAVPDFDCRPCLEKVWGDIEVVSYIERMRRVKVEVLANVFDPAAYDTPLKVEKIHIDIRLPYLSAKAKTGLVTGLDFNKDKLEDTFVVYLPEASSEMLSFECKIKVVLDSGESAESAGWETVTDSLDLTLGTFHVKRILGREG